MKLPALFLVSALFALAARADDAPPSDRPVPTHPPEAYAAVGAKFIHEGHLDRLGWSEAEIAGFVAGVRAALHGQSIPPTPEARELDSEIIDRIHRLDGPSSDQAFARPGELEMYLRHMQHRYNLQRTESGMCYEVKAGGIGGQRPSPRDIVVISLACVAADGSTKLPQLSMDRARIRVADLLPGLAEGVQMMTLDSQGRFILPPKLSFGDGAWPDGVPRGSPLLYTVVLHEVVPASPTP